MKKPLEDLNIKLPDIKMNNMISKSVKESNKYYIQKIKDKNIIRFKRNIDLENHFKYLSRNNKNIKVSENENDLSIDSQEKLYSNKINFNNTPNKNVKTLDNKLNLIYSTADELKFNNKNLKNNSLNILDYLELKTNNIS